MNTITLETESYLIKGIENSRFLPFLELEFNEWVIYENDCPKYYFKLQSETQSEFKIINWLSKELEKGKDLRNLILQLGNKNKKRWDIFPSQLGMEVENSYKKERIKLEFLKDDTIEG